MRWCWLWLFVAGCGADAGSDEASYGMFGRDYSFSSAAHPELMVPPETWLLGSQRVVWRPG